MKKNSKKLLYAKKPGFTLIETIVAFFVLLVAILFILQLYVTGQSVFLKSQFRTEAVKLGQEVLEAKRTESNTNTYEYSECRSAANGNYYQIDFTNTSSPSIAAIENSTYGTPDTNVTPQLKTLDVIITGPYNNIGSSSQTTCENLKGQLAPGNVTIRLQTLVSTQKIDTSTSTSTSGN